MLYVGGGETNLGSVDRLEYEYLTHVVCGRGVRLT